MVDLNVGHRDIRVKRGVFLPLLPLRLFRSSPGYAVKDPISCRDPKQCTNVHCFLGPGQDAIIHVGDGGNTHPALVTR